MKSMIVVFLQIAAVLGTTAADPVFDAAVDASKQKAAERYPDLRNPESALFKAVAAVTASLQENKPWVKQNQTNPFTSDQWPLQIAESCDRYLKQVAAQQAQQSIAQQQKALRDLELLNQLNQQMIQILEATKRGGSASRLKRLADALAVPSLPQPQVVVPMAPNAAIESRIDGDFEGWTGDTIFKLENGQIWQQVAYAYFYRYAFRPKVVIFQASGKFLMKVEGVDKTIQVQQLK